MLVMQQCVGSADLCVFGDRYYCMLYLLRSAARLGSVAPSLWGPFSTTDLPSWGDAMTLDYNQEANFWGVQVRCLALSRWSRLPLANLKCIDVRPRTTPS